MAVVRILGKFARREDGSLLVFFLVCIVALLGILALSFDMGRRAATQSDMQSFADNVALAAAGELDGAATAIARATTAANEVIIAANETLKAGTAGQEFELAIAELAFYEDLPERDTPSDFSVAALSASKYTLPPDALSSPYNNRDNGRARFVGVRLEAVDVDWLFAPITGAGLTADAAADGLSAIAVAGNTAWTCDVAPLMFCLPQTATGPDIMDIGDSILLRSGGNANNGNTAAWGPGDFGFLDLSQIPVDEDGPCDVNAQAERDACVLNVLERVTQCFEARGVDMEPGQRSGLDGEVYNMRFDMFRGAYNQGYDGDPLYAPGPHTVRGIVPGNANQTICQAQNMEPSGDTVPFPEDDCFRGLDPDETCDRHGNGNWSVGLDQYVDRNYGAYEMEDDADGNSVRVLDGNGLPIVVPGSGTGGLNEFFALGDTDYFGDPVYDQEYFPDFRFTGYEDMTRYEFYRKEIDRAFTAGAMSDDDLDHNRDDWTSRWGNEEPQPVSIGGVETAIWPILPDRPNDNGLPQCSPEPSVISPLLEERRVITIAGIDCVTNPVNGADVNVPVAQFYRAFLMKPVQENGENPPVFDLWMEIIEPVGGTQGGTIATGIYRELVQLYR